MLLQNQEDVFLVSQQCHYATNIQKPGLPTTLTGGVTDRPMKAHAPLPCSSKRSCQEGHVLEYILRSCSTSLFEAELAPATPIETIQRTREGASITLSNMGVYEEQEFTYDSEQKKIFYLAAGPKNGPLIVFVHGQSA